MEELENLLWNGKFDEVKKSCKIKLEENPLDAESWYYLFLAENKNFTEVVHEISDEMALKKAFELSDEKKRKILEDEWRILSELKEIPHLSHLYLSLKNDKKNDVLADERVLFKNHKKMDMNLSIEFMMEFVRLLSGDEKIKYEVFFYFVTQSCNDLKLEAMFQKLTGGTVTKEYVWCLINQNQNLSMEHVKEAKDAVEENNLKMESLNSEIKALEDLINEKKEELDACKAKAEALKNKLDDAMPKTGSSFVLGRYMNADIRWRILAMRDGKALIITEEIMNLMYFGFENNVYEKSEARRWLNEEFYVNAFTEEEKKRICKTHVSNTFLIPNGNVNPNSSRDTEDHVFLLSMNEAKRYFMDNASRVGYITRTYFTKGVLAKTPMSWWLRTPSYTDTTGVARVTGVGVLEYYYSCDENFGIRPCMWINL